MKNITACLVIHNEEKLLERCLKSIQDYVDQIIVVHDGPCTDRSLIICKKYRCKIYVKKFAGAAEAHRVWLYKQVKTDWILQIDADEFLSASLQKNIQRLVSEINFAGYEFIWPYWNGKKYKTKKWPWKLALFQHKKLQYLGALHEALMLQGPTKKVPLILEHRPNYDNFTFNTFRTKTMRWIKIHAKTFFVPPHTIAAFPRKSANQTIHYSFLKQHPILYMIPIGAYHFAGTFLLGGYKEGFPGFKVCFMMGLYYSVLCWEVYKIKSLKN